MNSNRHEPIWTPLPRPPRDSEIDHFLEFLGDNCGLQFTNYQDLWHFSVTEIEIFWDLCWRYFDIVGERPPELRQSKPPVSNMLKAAVLTSHDMPGFRFFPDSKLNFVENAYQSFRDPARVISLSETNPRTKYTYASEIWSKVSKIANGLREIGVVKGDRVVGYLPNIEETLIAFLATASIGAIWSCCSPDFGTNAVTDRFAQITPKVMFAIDGYVYSSKTQDRSEVVSEIASKLPSLEAVIGIELLDTVSEGKSHTTNFIAWDNFGSPGHPLDFERVEFSDPLWILYSSGTTGLPKAIVHSHGGVTLELKKQLAFQQNLGYGSRFFWFTTTGWMMWNFLVSGVLVGSDIVLFDGNPGFPDMSVLWQYAEELEITDFGISAAFISNCIAKGVTLEGFSLSTLRTVCSTGAPLSDAGFRWLRENLDDSVQIISESGGTDVCTAFLASSPITPTFAGKLSARALGASIQSFSSSGNPEYGKVGELVVTEPMPSMPVFLWGDNDGSRIRSSYFDRFPGVWSHGDWIEIDDDGTSVIFGRSDSTLNRGGIRMGTSEFYKVIEKFPEIVDSLVVDTSTMGNQGEIIVFVELKSGANLDDQLVSRIRHSIRTELSPRHVPDRLIQLTEIPRTLNGKKLEVPVRRLLLGESLSEVISLGSVANPAVLDSIAYLAHSDLNDHQEMSS